MHPTEVSCSHQSCALHISEASLVWLCGGVQQRSLRKDLMCASGSREKECLQPSRYHALFRPLLPVFDNTLLIKPTSK